MIAPIVMDAIATALNTSHARAFGVDGVTNLIIRHITGPTSPKR